jgi:hypothetical protein
MKDNVRWILENRDILVLVEGHTDYKGSREANLAMGRATCQVRRQLSLEGRCAGEVPVDRQPRLGSPGVLRKDRRLRGEEPARALPREEAVGRAARPGRSEPSAPAPAAASSADPVAERRRQYRSAR